MKEHVFGLVGCGLIADFHLRAIAEIPGTRVAAVSDVNEERGRSVAAKCGARFYGDFRDLARDDEVQIVNICTPSGLHLEPALAAIENHKHVIVEKPLEVTLDRCDRVIDAAERAGVKVGVIFPVRFSETSELLKRAVREKRFGRVTLADAYVKWWRSQEYYDKGGWRGTWKMDGGGALMNQSIHSVDLLNYLVGPVTSVQAFCGTLAHRNIEVEDTAVAVLRFSSGALGVIEGTTGAYPGFLKRLEICGQDGSVVLEENTIRTWKFREERPEDAQILSRYGGESVGGAAADPAAIGHQGHRKQIVEFLQALAVGREPAVNGREGRKSVQIVLGIYESARTGKVVEIVGA